VTKTPVKTTPVKTTPQPNKASPPAAQPPKPVVEKPAPKPIEKPIEKPIIQKPVEKKLPSTEKIQKPQSSTISASPAASSKDYSGHISAITFTLRALNKQSQPKQTGGDLAEIILQANGEKITLIEDSKDGTYTFDYPTVPGDNLLEATAKGKCMFGFPVQFRRKTVQEIQLELEQREAEEKMAEEMRRLEEERRKEEEQRSQASAGSTPTPTGTAASNPYEGLTDEEIKKRKMEEKNAKLLKKKKKA